jgi:hypothetical protein
MNALTKNFEGEFMMMEQMKKLMVEEEGQGMAEYGLILAGNCTCCYGRFYCTWFSYGKEIWIV